jgi:hypothetical protein
MKSDSRLILREYFSFVIQYLYPVVLLTNQAISLDSLNKLAANTITFFISEDFLPSDSGPLSSNSKITWFGSASRVFLGFVPYSVFRQARVGFPLYPITCRVCIGLLPYLTSGRVRPNLSCQPNCSAQ